MSGRALVTGGAGFIGSHVVDAFLGRGYDVLALDDLSSGKRDNVDKRASFAQVDIVDAERLSASVREFGPTVVCHLAAQASVTYSVREPAHDLEINVRGTLNVCEVARESRAPVVFASTGGALYGDGVPLPTTEDVHPHPLSPYGASKQAGEAYVTTWARLYELPNVVLRLGNVYGPRQNPHGEAGVVAIFSEKLHAGEAPRIFGDGEQTRDYIHVGDVARAFVLAAESGRRGTFNVGTGKATSVNELLQLVQSAAGTSAEPQYEPLRPGELLASALDAAALGEAVGWRPEVELATGIAETYRSYVGG